MCVCEHVHASLLARFKHICHAHILLCTPATAGIPSRNPAPTPVFLAAHPHTREAYDNAHLTRISTQSDLHRIRPRMRNEKQPLYSWVYSVREFMFVLIMLYTTVHTESTHANTFHSNVRADDDDEDCQCISRVHARKYIIHQQCICDKNTGISLEYWARFAPLLYTFCARNVCV